jgi:hypothetical protein
LQNQTIQKQNYDETPCSPADLSFVRLHEIITFILQMQVDLNTWIGDFNKTLSQGSITTELQDILDHWFQEKVQE